MEKELRFFFTNREGAKGAKEEKKEGGLSLIEWCYIMSGRVTAIFVGAGSPTILANN